MKPEAQRIAIAEACPNIVFHEPSNKWQWTTDKAGCWFDCHNNDPLNDLNAMHEAVEQWRTQQGNQFFSSDFQAELFKVVWGCPVGDAPAMFFFGSNGAMALINATAAQRAEAFLRTINKWVED